MPDALRVALVAGTLRVGGAEKQLTYMAEALAAAGAEVAVFSLGGSEEPFAVRLRGRDVPVWTMPPSRSRAVRIVRLVSAVRRFDPDLIQATHFFAGFYAVAAGLALGRPVIGAVRSDFLQVASHYGVWTRWLYTMPWLLITNSQAALANTARLGFDPARLRLIPNVISLQGWRRRETGGPDVPGRRVVAIAVANLLPTKRLDRFIEALAIARRSCPELCGVIAGAGELDAKLRSLAASLELDETALRFAGHCDDVNALLLQADFLCLTSAGEGMPNAVLEAMATGLPAISTDVGDVGLLIEDGISGYVVPEDDIQSVAARMAELGASPELRCRMGQAGRARVERDFSPDALWSQLRSVYRDVAARAQRTTLLQKIDRLSRNQALEAR